MGKESSLVKNTIIYALGDITPKVLGLLVLPLMTAYLSPSQYGVINYVNAIVTFLSILSVLSLNTYYLVHFYRQDNAIEQRKLLGSLSLFVLGVNTVLAIILFTIGAPLFDSLGRGIDFFPFIALGVGTNFMQTFSVLPSALYRLREKPLTLSMLVIARSMLQVGLGLIFVIYYNAGVMGVLWGNFIVATVFAVVFAVITYRHSILQVDWGVIKRALKFSLPLLPGSLAYYFTSLSDRIFIERYLSSFDLGIYTTAANLALIVNIIAYGAYKAYEPQFFKNFGKPDFMPLFNRVRNGFLFVMLAGVMGIGLFAREFFEIFTSPAYHIAYYYTPMILAGVLFFAISTMYGTVITAQGRTKISSAITISGGAVSVILNITLLPILGIAAAAITSGMVFGMMMMASIYISKIRLDIIRPLASILAAGVALYIGVYVIGGQSFWVGVATKGGIFVVACGAIIWLLQIRYQKLVLTLRGK